MHAKWEWAVCGLMHWTPQHHPFSGATSSRTILQPPWLPRSDNPTGTLSISDLELTGVLAHTDVLTQDYNVRKRTIWLASDNRAAVAWATKGFATSLAARLHLLRLNAMHQRAHRYVARHHYIPGRVNAMADDGGTLLTPNC